MSESILNALMHLFAVFATVQEDHVADSGRRIIQQFLLRYLQKKEVITEYISLFDNYLDFYRRDSAFAQEDLGFQNQELDRENLSRICRQIRTELNRHERIIVLLRLIEFVLEDEIISSLEDEFISQVGIAFSIKGEELQNAVLFVDDKKHKKIPEEFTLLIKSEDEHLIDQLEGDWVDKNRPDRPESIQLITRPGLQGNIIILHFPSLNIFVFKYLGPDILSVDGNLIESGQVQLFDNGSIIRGSGFEPVYYSEIASRFLQAAKTIRITMNARNIEFRFPNSSNGIRRFSFSEESGLVGVMGGSGVGKSTLLNLLSGQLPLHNGSVHINEYDLHRDRYKLKGVIGFVPQDDLLFEELTIFQNLYFNAKLCFGQYNETQIRQTVEKILRDLDLYEARNLKVGNPLNKFISGGQRKRLNIGLELMREPSILFVDEPTSGLSSNDAENVIRLLKEQTIKGKLVIANLHQPNSNIFKMIDKLWVFDKGGFPVYSGNPIDAIIYFKKLSSYAEATETECSNCGYVNPDQILEIVEAKLVDEAGSYSSERKISPEAWYEHYQQNISSGIQYKEPKKILPESKFRLPDIGIQFLVFLRRNLISKLSNTQYVLLTLLEAPILAALLAYFTKYIAEERYVFIDNKNLPAYLFMSVIVAIFLGLIISAEEIIRDRKILQRESFLNLSWFSYINSKLIYLFMLSAIQMLLYVIVGNWILEIKGMTLYYWLILFSTAACANMVGLNISAGLKSIVNIYIVIPLILIPQLLLSGITVKFDDLHKSLTSQINVPILGDLMISRWGYEALAVEQAVNNRYDRHFYEVEQGRSAAGFKVNHLVPRLQSKLDEVERNMDVNGNPLVLEKNLDLLRREVEKLQNHPDLAEFEYLVQLNPNDFTQDAGIALREWLDWVRFINQGILRDHMEAHDEVYAKLVDSLGDEGIVKLRQDYQNTRLLEMVTNRENLNRIIEVGNRLVQKSDPVYMMPESNWGRAQFYAPYKKFNDQLTETKWFNVSLLWIFSFILYVTLLLDLLRLINEYLSAFRFRRKQIR